MRTLLTGFGPFGTVVDNPTARIVSHFAQTGAPGHELVTRVFPVSYARVDRDLTDLLRTGNFDAALLLGVAGKRRSFCFERLSRNLDSARIPDADGEPRQSIPIRSDGPETHRTTLKLGAVAAHLRAAGLPARISTNAGAYLCNHAYYIALNAIAESNLRTACLFLHVPPDDQTFAKPRPAAPLSTHIEGVRLTLDCLREFAQ